MAQNRRQAEAQIWEVWDREMEDFHKEVEEEIRINTVTGPIFLITAMLIALIAGLVVALLVRFL